MIETKIIDWFRKVFPTPASRNFNTQIGCHFEEVSEMLSALAGDDAASAERIETLREQIGAFADAVKGGQIRLSVKDPVELLDSICDQVVTGVGTGYLAGLDVPPRWRRSQLRMRASSTRMALRSSTIT